MRGFNEGLGICCVIHTREGMSLITPHQYMSRRCIGWNPIPEDEQPASENQLDPEFVAKMHSEDTFGLDDDLNAYRWAVAGEGPYAYDWSDKPHRLVYDLVHIAQALREELSEYTDRGIFP